MRRPAAQCKSLSALVIEEEPPEAVACAEAGQALAAAAASAAAALSQATEAGSGPAQSAATQAGSLVAATQQRLQSAVDGWRRERAAAAEALAAVATATASPPPSRCAGELIAGFQGGEARAGFKQQNVTRPHPFCNHSSRWAGEATPRACAARSLTPLRDAG